MVLPLPQEEMDEKTESETLVVAPAQIISANLDSEYDLENFRLQSTLSSMYKKLSEWSLPKPKHVNLFTLNEEDHDNFLAKDGCGADNNFDDVVDEII